MSSESSDDSSDFMVLVPSPGTVEIVVSNARVKFYLEEPFRSWCKINCFCGNCNRELDCTVMSEEDLSKGRRHYTYTTKSILMRQDKCFAFLSCRSCDVKRRVSIGQEYTIIFRSNDKTEYLKMIIESHNSYTPKEWKAFGEGSPVDGDKCTNYVTEPLKLTNKRKVDEISEVKKEQPAIVPVGHILSHKKRIMKMTESDSSLSLKNIFEYLPVTEGDVIEF